MAAARGPFICQSQSLNIHMADPTVAKLTGLHLYAWKSGLKTGMYYLRTKPKAEAIAFTVDPAKAYASDPAKAFASDPAKAFASDPAKAFASDPAKAFASDPARAYASDPAKAYASDAVCSRDDASCLSCQG
jgi:ribonucleoside-diphosphate reductase subunit M1